MGVVGLNVVDSDVKQTILLLSHPGILGFM